MKIDKETKNTIRSIVGQGFHTMLRKGFDGGGSGEMWQTIRELTPSEWNKMLDYWIVNPLVDEIFDKMRAERCPFLKRSADGITYCPRLNKIIKCTTRSGSAKTADGSVQAK